MISSPLPANIHYTDFTDHNQSDQTKITNSIGLLENHMHGIFAGSRVPLTGDDFVYVPNSELFNALDDYCATQTMHEARQPLLITGEMGCGKSALLANWIHRRTSESARHHTRAADTQELIIHHSCGATRQSICLPTLLFRIITYLKERFELPRELPTSDEKVAWELPRFLDQAAKKGRIILIIDGINRLVGREIAGQIPTQISGQRGSNIASTDPGLAWLPTTFPSNVRVILSATSVQTPDDEICELSNNSVDISQAKFTVRKPSFIHPQAHVSRYIRLEQEAERRSWLILRFPIVTDITQSQAIIQSYLYKTIQTELATQANSQVFLTESNQKQDNDSNAKILGFLLFECHIKSLLDHKLAYLPMFIRLMLQNAWYAVRRGFSLWVIWDDWLQANTVDELVSKIISTYEHGYQTSSHQTQRDYDQAIQSGGLASLRRLYPEHPTFILASQSTVQTSSIQSGGIQNDLPNMDTSIVIDIRNDSENAGYMPTYQSSSFRSNSLMKMQSFNQPPGGFQDSSHGNGEIDRGALSYSVFQNLGDEAWLSTSEEADFKIEEAMVQGEHALEQTIESITRSAEEKGIPFLEALAQHMARVVHNKNATNTSTHLQQLPISDNRKASLRSLKDGTDLTVALATVLDDEDQDDEDQEVMSKSGTNPGTYRTAATTSPREGAVEGEDSLEDVPVFLPMMPLARDNSVVFRRTSTFKPANVHATYDTTQAQSLVQASRLSSSYEDFDEVTATQDEVIEDPKQGIETLPAYLIGESAGVSGTSTLLSSACCLLYVARHGLKESELYSILATYRSIKQDLDNNQSSNSQESQSGHIEYSQENISLIHSLVFERGRIEELCRTYDQPTRSSNQQSGQTNRKGVISLSQLINCIQAALPSVKKSCVLKCLELLHLEYQEIYPNYNDSNDDKCEVAYLVLFKSAVKKASFFKEKKSNKPKHDPASQQNKAEENELGPVLEETLLSMLENLGILYSSDHHVLILPSESIVLRQVIENNYISPGEGADLPMNIPLIQKQQYSRQNTYLQFWHDQLIQYFKSSENSMRRCEELPWHLQICRRWYALRDVISDLSTFELMMGGGYDSLKGELIGYWLLLTEGTLLSSHSDDSKENVERASHTPHEPQKIPADGIINSLNRAHSLATMALSSIASQLDNPDDEIKRTLAILDTAAAFGLSERESKLTLLQNLVAPFDIVEELNRSLEEWVVATHPSPNRIYGIISKIGSFLTEFSQFHKPPPSFLRLGVDIDGMNTFGVNVSEEGIVSPTSVALKKDIPSPRGMGKTIESLKYPNSNSTFPTSLMLESCPRLYHYYRWLWIQFPWMSLRNALEAGSSYAIRHESQAPLSTTQSDNEFRSFGEAENSNALNRTGTQCDYKFWEVKKQDPNREVAVPNINRKLAFIKTGVAPIHMDSLSSLGVVFQRLIDDANHQYTNAQSSPSQASFGDNGVLQTKYNGVPATKYRRTFQEEIEYGKTIPFAGHSSRIMKAGTLFPTLEKTIQKKNTLLEATLPNLYRDATANLKRGGEGLPTQTPLADLIAAQREAEDLVAFNTGPAGEVPISQQAFTMSQLFYQKEFDRIVELKRFHNRIRSLRKTRESQLQSMKETWQHRKDQDAAAAATMNEGEATIHRLTANIQQCADAGQKGRLLQRGYQLIVDLEASCPPYSTGHLQTIEAEVELAKSQVGALIGHRQKLYAQMIKDIQNRRRLLLDKSEYYRTAKSLLDKRVGSFVSESITKRLPLPLLSGVGNNITASASIQTAYRTHGVIACDDNANSQSCHADDKDHTVVLNDVMRKFGDAISWKTNMLSKLNAPRKDDQILLQASSELPSCLPTVRLSGMEDIGSPMNGMNSPGLMSPMMPDDLPSVTSQFSTTTNIFKDELTSPPGTAIPPKKPKAMSARQQIRLLREKTGCNNVNEFLDRFKESVRLSDTLRSHQILADSKIATLRAEYNELYGATSAEKVATVGSDAPNQQLSRAIGSEDEKDGRHLDHKLMEAEVRLHHAQKRTDRAIKLTNEVKMGVWHLMSLIEANKELLTSLPKHPAPKLDDPLSSINLSPPEISSNSSTYHVDDRVVQGLSWCEERLLAINEVMMLENTKQNPTGGAATSSMEQLSIQHRQTALASAVLDSTYLRKLHEESKGSLHSPISISNASRGGKEGVMMNPILRVLTDTPSANYIPRGQVKPSAVLVPSHAQFESIYNEKTKQINDLRDSNEISEDKVDKEDLSKQHALDVQRFVDEALQQHEIEEMLRKANTLAKRKLKKERGMSGYGLALHSVLSATVTSSTQK